MALDSLFSSSKLTRFTVLILLMLVQAKIQAQDNTPVRSIGQSSPGMELKYNQPSDGLSEQMTQREVGTTEYLDEPTWESAEAIALESMDVSAFDFKYSIFFGAEYETLERESAFISSGAYKESFASYFARIPLGVRYEGNRLNFQLIYSPEYRIDDHERDNDGRLNHSLSAAASYSTPKSQVSFNLGLTESEGGENVELGGDRVDALNANASLSGSYRLSRKTSLTGDFSTQITDTQDHNSFGLYNITSGLAYSWSVKLQTGASLTYSRSDVDTGANSNAIGMNATATWLLSQKFAATGSVGWQILKFDGGVSDGSPIFSLGANYRLSELTNLNINAYRASFPSVSDINQSYYATGLSIGLTQKILDRIDVTLTGGYELSEYVGAFEDVVTRQDVTYWFLRQSINYTIRQKYTVSLYYQHASTDGNGDVNHTYERDIIGASFTYTF